MSIIDPPNTLTPKTPIGLGASATLTPVTEAATNPDNARILYDNLLVGADSADAKKMIIPNTYERFFIPQGTTIVKLQLSAPSEFNYVAFGAHEFGAAATGTNGVSIGIKYATSIGGALTQVSQFNHKTNDAFMIELPNVEGVSIAEIEVSFFLLDGSTSVGVIYAGNILEMQRSIYGGHSPADLSQKTSYQSTMSESGQFLGRTVTRRGSETSFSWRHLEPDWYRDNFQPFVQSSVTTPFFINWKPSLTRGQFIEPEESVFGFTTGDIKPINMGGGSDLMSVSFNFKGHSD